MSEGVSQGLRRRVVLVGASGFIGQALAQALGDEFHVVALTRSPALAAAAPLGDKVQWQHCDLYDLEALTQALRGFDTAVYLVHSLRPSSRLTQAEPRDMDLVLADNFARAAKASGLGQIVYLSSLMPRSFRISSLLWSHREVELALQSQGTPLTVLRAGLVVGPGGTATRLMVELVRRLGYLYLPPSARSVTYPIALRDLIRALRVVLQTPQHWLGSYDLTGPDKLSFEQLLRMTAARLGLKRRFVRVPWLPERFMAWSMRWITGTPIALAGQVIGSLPADADLRPNALQDRINEELLGFDAALEEALDSTTRRVKPGPRQAFEPQLKSGLRQASLVRSIQRIITPPGMDSSWVARNYWDWLGSCCGGLVKTQWDSDHCVEIGLRFPQITLLKLCLDSQLSTAERQIYRVDGGFLAGKGPGLPRFEFHCVLEGRYTMAAIHDFAPRLPWYVYIWTQAIAHLWVMRRYQKHLARLAR